MGFERSTGFLTGAFIGKLKRRWYLLLAVEPCAPVDDLTDPMYLPSPSLSMGGIVYERVTSVIGN